MKNIEKIENHVKSYTEFLKETKTRKELIELRKKELLSKGDFDTTWVDTKQTKNIIFQLACIERVNVTNFYS